MVIKQDDINQTIDGLHRYYLALFVVYSNNNKKIIITNNNHTIIFSYSFCFIVLGIYFVSGLILPVWVDANLYCVI